MIPARVPQNNGEPHPLAWIDEILTRTADQDDRLFFIQQVIARAEQNGVEAAAREADRLRRLAGAAEMQRERNRLIREALRALYGGLKRTAAARALARDLRVYASGAWPRQAHMQEPPPGSSDARRLHHAILRANGGKPLAYRRIMEISA